MKKIFLAVMFVSCATTMFAQAGGKKTPDAVVTAFTKTFPAAEKVKWGKEKSDYEAEFSLNGKNMAAVYDKAGKLKETEEDIATKDLPSAVQSYVKEHYKNAVIKEAAKISTPAGVVTYEAEVNKTDLIFDTNGKFIRSEKDKD